MEKNIFYFSMSAFGLLFFKEDEKYNQLVTDLLHNITPFNYNRSRVLN